ncbi:putative membrane protein, partial [Chlamydia psittaci 84-8471/1]
WKRFKNMR